MDASKLPPVLKPISAYLKVANEYDKRDPVVSYFCRLYCVQKGISIDSKSPDCKMFLLSLMDNLEQVKKKLAAEGQEAVSNEIVGQAHVESIALNLFNWADREDRKSNFNKGLIKAFYSANLLFDVLKQFGDISDEISYRQRYAKWKATYIHKCLQSGETPIPGPQGSEFEGAEFESSSSSYEQPSNQPQDQQQDQPSISAQLPYPSAGYHPNYPQPQGPNSNAYPPPQQHNELPKPSSNPPSSSVASAQDYAASTSDTASSSSSSSGSSRLTAEDYQLATKYCKYAISSMQYEDVSTAIENLTKALHLLKNK